MYTSVDINTNLKTVYMACPYSSYIPDAGCGDDLEADQYFVKEKRLEESFEKANRAAAYLMVDRKRVVFSPITHSHILDKLTNIHTHSFWLTQDYYWVKMCDELWILQLNGWDSSFGVGWEHGLATVLEKPIYYLDFKKVESWERSLNMLSDSTVKE